MRRLGNTLVYVLAALVLCYSVGRQLLSGSIGEARRPTPEAEQQQRRPVGGSEPLPAGPVVTVEVGAKHNSIGTAFIVADGWWLTARHVVHGCDVVGLRTGPRRGIRVDQVYLHPESDLALLRTGLRRTPLPVARRYGFAGNLDGFASGYPQGRPGDVHGQYMGRIRLRSVGRYKIEQNAVAWAERRRSPADLPALGGLSGGPLFDRQGKVVGVLVASSRRRGRIITTSPANIDELLTAYAVPVDGRAPARPVDAASYVGNGDTLRRDLRIAQVFCKVD